MAPKKLQRALEMIRQEGKREDAIILACDIYEIRCDAYHEFYYENGHVRRILTDFEVLSKWNDRVAKHYVGVVLDRTIAALDKVSNDQAARDRLVETRKARILFQEGKMAKEEEMKYGVEKNTMSGSDSEVEFKDTNKNTTSTKPKCSQQKNKLQGRRAGGCLVM